GKSPEDQRSDAGLPLRLAGRIDARDPCGSAGTWRYAHKGLVPGREEPAHAIRVPALVLAVDERASGAARSTPDLRAVRAGASKPARLPRRPRRSAGLLAETHQEGRSPIGVRDCRGDSAPGRHSGFAPRPLRYRRSGPCRTGYAMAGSVCRIALRA